MPRGKHFLTSVPWLRVCLTSTLCALIHPTIVLSAEPADSEAHDFKVYLQEELQRLGNMAKTAGLNDEAKQYIKKRIQEIQSRMASASDSVPEQMVEFMNTRAFGTRFVFVLDKSRSMAGRRLQLAKLELLKSIAAIKQENSFYVIFYDTEAYKMPGGNYVQPSGDNVEACEEWLNHIRAKGRTKPDKALFAALLMKPDAIFLLSDGLMDEGIPPYIRALNKEPSFSVIHTITFKSEEGAPLLGQIASENAGQFTHINPDDERWTEKWFGKLFRPVKKLTDE